MQFPRSGDHVVAVAAVGQPRSKEDPSEMDVVSDVASPRCRDRHAYVPSQDLYRHGGLLMSDAGEGNEAVL
jgi:hypothetical protein